MRLLDWVYQHGADPRQHDAHVWAWYLYQVVGERYREFM